MSQNFGCALTRAQRMNVLVILTAYTPLLKIGLHPSPVVSNIPVKTNLCEQLLAHTTGENFTPKFTDSPRLTVKCSQCTLNNYLKSHFQRKVVVGGVWSSAIGRSASEVTTLWHYTNMSIIIIIII